MEVIVAVLALLVSALPASCTRASRGLLRHSYSQERGFLHKHLASEEWQVFNKSDGLPFEHADAASLHGNRQNRVEKSHHEAAAGNKFSKALGDEMQRKDVSDFLPEVKDQADDWKTSLIALGTNVPITILIIVITSFLRRRFPLIYSKHAWDNWGYCVPGERSPVSGGLSPVSPSKQLAWKKVTVDRMPLPDRPEGTLMDWIPASRGVTIEQVIGCVGLDQAMLLEFTHMAMKTFATIGIPMCVIVIPIHIYFGTTQDARYLSWTDFSNLPHGSRICWLHALLVWFVVLTVDSFVYKSQAVFCKHRIHWLSSMASLRSRTILVEEIPPKWNTNKRLKEYFNMMVADQQGSVIQEANVIMRTDVLLKLLAQKEMVEELVKVPASERKQSTGPLTFTSATFYGQPVQSPEDLLEDINEKIVEERTRLDTEVAKVEAGFDSARVLESGSDADSSATPRDDAAKEAEEDVTRRRTMMDRIDSMAQIVQKKPDNYKDIKALYCNSGFVTFFKRSQAQMALRLAPYVPDRDTLAVSSPPPPTDVRYGDFKVDRAEQHPYDIMGVALIVLVFFCFLPLICLIATMASFEFLSKHSGAAKNFMETYPGIVGPWNAIAPVVALNLVMGFLPTILVIISQACFKLKADVWAQHHLQKWYFRFLVIFQLIVLTASASVFNSLDEFYKSPDHALAAWTLGICNTSHFYINFFFAQLVTLAMMLTRSVQLLKYLLNRFLQRRAEKSGQEAPADTSPSSRQTPGSRINEQCLQAAMDAEPEDQDYDGVGARMARCSSLFVIGIVFISLCPLISIAAWLTFALMRLVLGYLVVFQETKKPDLGGYMWVSSLRQVQGGLLIYIVVMAGVLHERSDTAWPSRIAALAGVYVTHSFFRFKAKFDWENLCTEAVMRLEESEILHHHMPHSRTASRKTYKQPELCEEAEEKNAYGE